MMERASRMEPSPASASRRECGFVGVDALVLGDAAQLGEDVDQLDGVKAEVLAARADGLGDVFGLGGGHHEDDVVGRLLEGFEQRVEGGVGDLVGLVEDVDLVLVARRGGSGRRRAVRGFRRCRDWWRRRFR